ncbi:MAG: hypothetical protein AAF736_04535 [Pseudomonadota bacterium]
MNHSPHIQWKARPAKLTRTLLVGMALTALLALPWPAPAEEALWSAVGGKASWWFDAKALQNLGLKTEGADEPQADGRGRLKLDVPISRTGTLEFDGTLGRFNRLHGGSLLLDGGSVLAGPGGRIDLRNLRLTPLTGTRDTALAARLPGGQVALTLRYGHFEYLPTASRLNAHIMDAFAGPALAVAIGGAEAEGQYVGQVSLSLEVIAPQRAAAAKQTACGASPNWPTLPGFAANLEMQAIDQIVETATSRAGGRVAITPSAFFRNIGNADIPWYSMFTVPSSDSVIGNEGPDQNDDPDCLDNGSGQCQPYGVDQGGLLVWNVYRLTDGVLEQLGRSAVKHAWNSINGSCSCSGGRIVGAGCTDLYGVGNNSDRDVLGPRSEVVPAQALWESVDSIWDGDGDGRCDTLNPGGFPHDASWCRNTPTDEFDRRLVVQEADLQDPAARYFLEAWYLVRDDADVFDSMGFQEISPEFVPGLGANGLWRFPCTNGNCSQTFVGGPVLNRFVDHGAPTADQTSDEAAGSEGHYRLASEVTPLPGGRFRYRYTLMSFDYNRDFLGASIPLSAGADIDAPYFTDGDPDPGNDWQLTIDSNSVDFLAPASGNLSWGGLVSFGFDAASPPTEQPVRLSIDLGSVPGTTTLRAAAPVERVFGDGFETR